MPRLMRGRRRHRSPGAKDVLPDRPRRRRSSGSGVSTIRGRGPRRRVGRRCPAGDRGRSRRRGRSGLRDRTCRRRRARGLRRGRGRRRCRSGNRISGRRTRSRRRRGRRGVRRWSGLRIGRRRGVAARWRRRRLPRREDRERIDVSLRVGGDADPEVDVGLIELGRSARADAAQRGPFVDPSGLRDCDRAKMHEGDGVAVGGLDGHGLAVARHGSGKRHGPGRWRQHLRAGRPGDVDPAMLSA
jgi:hypothetical protein